MDPSSLISTFSALAAILSAFYAHLQVKQARESAEKTQKTLLEASTQNKINALIALKNHYEKELPRIKELAEHFTSPETFESVGKPLHAEHNEVRKKLQQVNGEIDKFFDLYVPARSAPNNNPLKS